MYLKLIFVACLIVGSYTSRTPAEIRQWMLSRAIDCTNHHFVSSKELQMMMNHQLPGTKNSDCFIACVFRKVDWLDEKGIFNPEEPTKIFETEFASEPTKSENAKKLFDLCTRVNDDAVSDGEAGCERANHLAKCLIDNAESMGFNLSKT